MPDISFSLWSYLPNDMKSRRSTAGGQLSPFKEFELEAMRAGKNLSGSRGAKVRREKDVVSVRKTLQDSLASFIAGRLVYIMLSGKTRLQKQYGMMDDVSSHDGLSALPLDVDRDVARRVTNCRLHPNSITQLTCNEVVHVHKLGQARTDHRKALRDCSTTAS